MPPSPHTGNRGQFSLRRIFAIAIGILFGSYVFAFVSNPAQWKYASAMNDLEQGNIDLAIEKMQEAIDVSGDTVMKLRLAQVYAENNQAALGITLCDQVLEENPDSEPARLLRSFCLQHQKRFQDALDEYKKVLSSKSDLSPVELNNLAYYRSLAREDLPKADRQISKALSKIRTQPWGVPYAVPLQVRSAVAIGVVSRKVHKETLAIRLLGHQITQRMDAWRRQNIAIKRLTSTIIGMTFPLRENTLKNIDALRNNQETHREALGLMLTIRAILHQDLGSPQCVSKDIQLLDEISMDFESLKDELPNEMESLSVLENATTYLDTRGFIKTRMRWQTPEVKKWAAYLRMQGPGMVSSYELALEDLNLAVASARLFQLATNGPLFNRYDLSPRYVMDKRAESLRTLAVLLSHRQEAHEKHGNMTAAKKDAAEIKELGMDKDSLF